MHAAYTHLAKQVQSVVDALVPVTTAVQQQAKRDEVDAGMVSAQNIAAIRDMMRAGASGEATPENKARAMVDYAAATIQALSGSGQSKMALAQEGDAEQIRRRIYGGLSLD